MWKPEWLLDHGIYPDDLDRLTPEQLEHLRAVIGHKQRQRMEQFQRQQQQRQAEAPPPPRTVDEYMARYG